MGLDQYAYFVSKRAALDDFHYDEQGKLYEDFYWRKNHFLHGWMEELFRTKGGEGIFNLRPIRLTLDDLSELEKTIKKRGFKNVDGFFWGHSAYTDYDAECDLKFIEKARWCIKHDGAVYYDSWW